MVPLIQLITGLLYPAGAVIKNMLAHQMGRLKLRQYPIYGGQTDFLALVHQRAVNIVGRHVFLLGGLKKTKNLTSRMSHLQNGFYKVVTLPWNESPPQSYNVSLCQCK